MLSPSHLAFISHKIHALTNYRPPKAHRCQLREVSFSGTYRPRHLRGCCLGIKNPKPQAAAGPPMSAAAGTDSGEGPLLVARLGFIALSCNCTQKHQHRHISQKHSRNLAHTNSCPRHLNRSIKVSKPQGTPHFSYYLMY